MPKGPQITQRSASILIEADEAAHAGLFALQTAYSDARDLVAEGLRVDARAIAMEDLANIRGRIKAGKRARSRLHRWGFPQLQGSVAYKAAEFRIATILVDPAYTSKTCSGCGEIGLRAKHCFACKCGRRAHSDVDAASNLARLGESALSPRADVNRPHVAGIGHSSLGQ